MKTNCCELIIKIFKCKILFLTMFIICTVTLCRAQWITIPDTSFANWLNNHYPTCMNGNQMDTTCNAIVSASVVSINTNIDSTIIDLTGIQYFDNLSLLFCLGTSNVSGNLTLIPSLPPFLNNLNCSNNQLLQLPVLPATLTNLNCANNQLSNLPTLPILLEQLSCEKNQLTILPTLPDSLTFLNCAVNQLTSLPTLPNLLHQFYCQLNSITTLPLLPDSLIELYCHNNQLNGLPSLPISLSILVCSGNPLTSLPTLPNSLTQLECNNNSLTNLPQLPALLNKLVCSTNLLTSLPVLPSQLSILDCSYNPYLGCLPTLGNNLSYLDFTFTPVDCIPNIVPIATSFPQVSSLPVCNLFNSNGCDFYWNIMGRVYVDLNGSCAFDSGDTTVYNIGVELYQNGTLIQQTFTRADGEYLFDVNTFGTYEVKIDTSIFPFSVNCPSGAIQTSIISVVDSLDDNVDFAFSCDSVFDISSYLTLINGNFFPGNAFCIMIPVGNINIFYGIDCSNGLSGVNGQILLTVTGPIQYNGYAVGSVAPTSVIGNIITWNISDFGTINLWNSFKPQFITDTTATIDDIICFNVAITSNPSDANQSNNNWTHCVPVSNSWDPNEKESSPVVLDSVNQFLDYTIHFQNTGTAPAQHIQIIDTLDSDLDFSTFQLLTYSHPNLTQVLEGGVVKFNFPNINLADSGSNEPASHGYIQYKIKPKSGTSLSSSFENTAYIYFDFNSPVVTNTTHTSFISGLQEASLTADQFLIFPNPVSTTITMQYQTTNSGKSTVTVENCLGQTLQTMQLTNNQKQTLDMSNYASGMYFIKCFDGKKQTVVKVVKE